MNSKASTKDGASTSLGIQAASRAEEEAMVVLWMARIEPSPQPSPAKRERGLSGCSLSRLRERVGVRVGVGRYLVFAAATSLSIAAAGVILSSFQNCETTSFIAPSIADGTAMPCAIDGTSVPPFALARKSAAEVFAHSSNLSSFMPVRTG